MKKELVFILWFLTSIYTQAQIKVLFDATKAETANNADWIIDADAFNLGYNPNPYIGGGEANPQRFPTPDQSTVTANTQEDYWTGANSAWGIELVQYGYQVETLPYDGAITYGDAGNPQDLSYYDVFIVTEPNILFTADEKTAIMEFVANGGGLFMTSDHDRSDRNGDGVDSVDVWNDLMQNNSVLGNPFGLLFDYENFSTTTYSIANLPGNPVLHGYFGDVTALELHGGTSISLFPGDNTSVTGLIFKQGTNITLFAAAEYGNGRVVAIGDSSPADDGTGDTHDNLYNGWYDEGNGSHRKLMLNATLWLAQDPAYIDGFANTNRIKLIVKDRYLQVKSPTELSVAQISIINMQGQLLTTQKYIPLGINVSFIPKGLYLVRIQLNNKAILIKKILLD